MATMGEDGKREKLHQGKRWPPWERMGKGKWRDKYYVRRGE
jgi:hypothetical protein